MHMTTRVFALASAQEWPGRRQRQISSKVILFWAGAGWPSHAAGSDPPSSSHGRGPNVGTALGVYLWCVLAGIILVSARQRGQQTAAQYRTAEDLASCNRRRDITADPPGREKFGRKLGDDFLGKEWIKRLTDAELLRIAAGGTPRLCDPALDSRERRTSAPTKVVCRNI
jgi:hypothetical protein